MAEKVKISDIVSNDFFGIIMIGILSEGGSISRFKIQEGSHEVDVDLRINGVEVPIRPYIESLEKQLDRMVNEAATKRILEAFSDKSERIQSLLYDAERNLKDKLREVGLFNEMDE